MAPDWPWNYRVISMPRVLIDACGWVAVIEAGINIDQALLDCVGTKELATVPNVISELKALEDRKLLISMLQSKVLLSCGDHNKTSSSNLFVVRSASPVPL